nr:hypothetical protein [Tanacetum cinerariifolium]
MRVDMDLFSFIRHSDPTKVLIGKKMLRRGSDSIDKLFNDGNDAEPEHPTERDDDVLTETIAKDVSEVVFEKTKKFKRKRKATGDASGSTLHPKDDGPRDFVFGLNLRTHPLTMRSPIADAPVMTVVVTTTIAADVSVVLVSKGRVESKNLENFRDSVSAGRTNANVTSSSKLNEPVTSSDSFYASQDLDSETLHRIYVPKWKVINDFVLDDPYVCRDLMDRLAPPALFSQLRAMGYDRLYIEFNVGAARQICLGAEVRMRAEHTLEQKDKLEDKCVEQVSLLSEKDAEITDLKSLLSLKEAEVTEAIRLRDQLSVMEVADAAKGNGLKGLKEKNLALAKEKNVLSKKVTTLESVTAAKEIELASLSAQFAKLTFDIWKRSIRIEAYDPFAKAKYVDAVNALHTMDFFLLSVLNSKKDACMTDLTDSLRLEGPLAKVIGAEELQPSLEQFMLPIQAEDDIVLRRLSYPSPNKSFIRTFKGLGEITKKRLSLTDAMIPLAETLSSKSLISEASTYAMHATVEPITTLSTTFASSGVVPPLFVSYYQVLDAEPHDEDPPAITFKEEKLDTTSKSAV